MMVNYKERKTISGEEALEEFLASKERWNAYVDKHNDNTEVDFSGVDFSKHRKGKGEFNFSEYLFPKNGGVSFASAIFGEGGVSFTAANFGDGDVSFSNTKFGKNGTVFFDHANFGDGEVNFSSAEIVNGNMSFDGVDFGDGDVSFSNTKFGKNGTVFFDHANFGDGEVNFSSAEIVNGNMSFDGVDFGEGGVNFSGVEFGTGDVNFSGVEFGTGDVNFTNARLGYSRVLFNDVKFGDGNVCFCNVRFCETNPNGGVSFVSLEFGRGDVDFEAAYFGKGMVTFEKTQFGNGKVKFNDAEFGDGDVEFSHAQFGNGDLEFKGAKFGNGTLNFEHCECKGYVSFQSMTDPKTLSKFSLRHSSFYKSLDISDNEFNCIPDLTNTKLTNQVSLGRMKIKKKYSNGGDHDGERLCRLKELAEANRSYQQALEFHLMEMRANRSLCNDKLVNILDIIFDLIAIYGQSIARPVLWLLGLTFVCTLIYANESSLDYFPFCYGFLYSVSQVFSFVPAGRSITIGILDKLFPCEPQQIPDVIYSLSLIQGVLSFLFLFLIGLGFRNRFRL